ncbi:EAL domain-containing protein [Rhizobiales bacterium]|uniref:EAL domain-containing protein n=1 Tax=Hongsoonwoonella zoysiae TaxID=2821844 RepID=UPI0015604189|nr:EAL domain-containing protein [Hongsoonwoonella zoysiae]NRG19640.1 EAL domain-containing protein [Hongsoonwoonella zoysiae]
MSNASGLKQDESEAKSDHDGCAAFEESAHTNAASVADPLVPPLDANTRRDAIIDASPASTLLCDRDYIVWEANAKFLDDFCLTKDDVIGHPIAAAIGKKIFERRKPSIDQALSGESTRLLEWQTDRSGARFILDISHVPLRDRNGEIVGTIISAIKASEQQELKQRLSMYREVLRQTTDRVGVIGTDYRYRFCNDANAAYHQRRPEDIIGCHLGDMIGWDLFEKHGQEKYDRCFAGESLEFDLDLTKEGQAPEIVNVRMYPYREGEDEITGAVVTIRDITGSALMAKEMRRRAREDALTGVYNRYALQERLEELLANASQKGECAALLTIDLDNFKVVNDLAGHAAGDALLCQIGEMLKAFKVSHGAMVARLGGDEFALVVSCLGECGAKEIGRQIVSNIQTMRFDWGGSVFTVDASVGIAFLDGKNIGANPVAPGDLMKWADQACLLAKETGGGRTLVFEPGNREMAARQAHVGNLKVLQQALDENAFCLFTMPIEAIDGSARVYHEVLLRVAGQDGQMLPPAPLIVAAERHGLMPKIDRWVICNVLQRLRAAPEDLRLSVNLSGQSVGDPAFKDLLLEKLGQYPNLASRLSFEITETATVRSMATAQALIRALRNRGCGVILDDFGAGLSSFAYLRQFEIDCLKIDGSIIGDVASDEVQRTIVAGIVAVANKLGIEVTAEFVEDRETMDILRELDVTFAQGYFVGKPVEWIVPGIT